MHRYNNEQMDALTFLHRRVIAISTFFSAKAFNLFPLTHSLSAKGLYIPLNMIQYRPSIIGLSLLWEERDG